MCISSMGSFQCGLEVLLIFFQLFRCRNLALNRVFSYFLVVGMFLYLGGVWTPPHLYTPICLYAPGVYTPPIGPHGLQCTCMVLEHLHVVGGCYLLKCVLGHLPYTSPIWGCLPLNLHPPHFIVGSLCMLFSRISVSYVGFFPSIEGFGGVPPSLWEVWGAHQLFSCPHAHSCTFFVVHYVSHFDHGSNYYYSSYSGIFWPVISVISDSGSFPDRVFQ